MATAGAGRYLKASGIAIFGLSLLLYAYASYVFTYDNLHVNPQLPNYQSAIELQALSFLVAAVGGLTFGAGWVVSRSRQIDPERSRFVRDSTAVRALLLFVLGSFLGAVPPLYSVERWQLAPTVSWVYFWEVVPTALIGAGWTLGALAYLLSHHEPGH